MKTEIETMSKLTEFLRIKFSLRMKEDSSFMKLFNNSDFLNWNWNLSIYSQYIFISAFPNMVPCMHA